MIYLFVFVLQFIYLFLDADKTCSQQSVFTWNNFTISRDEIRKKQSLKIFFLI